MFIRIKLMTIIIVSACLLAGCQEDLFPSNDQLSNPSSAEEGSLSRGYYVYFELTKFRHTK